MKEFHILSSGVSIITNAQREGIIRQEKISNERYWQQFERSSEYSKLKEYFYKDPKKASAELSTFLEVIQGKDHRNVLVYIFGTNTSANEICRKFITDYLNSNNFQILNPNEVSGYFREIETSGIEYAEENFIDGLSKLTDRLIRIARKKKNEGYKVFFNPTGGFKAHVIICAVAGFLSGCDVYYKNEEFNRVVFLPPMIYIPKGREKEVINLLAEKRIISSINECNKLIDKYTDEIERLRDYGLIDIEQNENNEIYRIKITERGLLIYEQIK